MKRTYITPAFVIKLGEPTQNVNQDIQLFRTGTFYHTEYGKFDITPEILKSMETNFKNKVRGVDLAIDYKHDSDDVAAGWIKDVYLDPTGNELWAKVDWTPTGAKVLSEKEFRYISPEFMFDYQDNETLKKFGPVLLGAGLTNRPTIKKMEPVVLSEKQPKIMEGIKYMDDISKVQPADLDQMSPEEIKALCLKLIAAQAEDAKEDAAGDEPAAPAPDANAAAMADMQKKMAAMEQAAKCSEFGKLLAEGKVCKAQEQAYLSGDMVKFVSLASTVKLNDGSGSSHTPVVVTPEVQTSEEAQDKVLVLAEAKAKELKITQSEAIRMVLSENLELKTKIYG